MIILREFVNVLMECLVMTVLSLSRKHVMRIGEMFGMRSQELSHPMKIFDTFNSYSDKLKM